MKRFIMIVCILISTESFSEKIAYILPDVANIRISPDVKSEMIARFLINTEVKIKTKKGEWRKIYVDNIEGWVHNSLLGKTPFTLSELIDSVKISDSPEGKKKWADRLIAAFPYENKNYKFLLDIYQKLDDSAGIKIISNRIGKKEEVYIARARFGEIQLLGKINSNGAFESSVKSFCRNDNEYENGDRPKDIEIKEKKFSKELKSLAWALTSRKWYSTSGPAPSIMFSQFELSPTEKEIKNYKNIGEYESLWLSHPRFLSSCSFSRKE